MRKDIGDKREICGGEQPGSGQWLISGYLSAYHGRANDPDHQRLGDRRDSGTCQQKLAGATQPPPGPDGFNTPLESGSGYAGHTSAQLPRARRPICQ